MSKIRLKSHFYPMDNVIQTYAWGSYTSIEEIFGIENQGGQPQAELWMGAHPNGCLFWSSPTGHFPKGVFILNG